MAVVAVFGAVLIAPAGSASAATSADIRTAQSNLDELAYRAGPVDGIAGPRTRAATVAVQKDRCLSVDGVIGPQTLGGLRALVAQVQTMAGVPADGVYGPATMAAVKSYQRMHGLEVDGIAGPITMGSMGIARTVSCQGSSGTVGPIVSIAKGEVGTRADARRCVPGKPYSICADWCAAFATWVWRSAGVGIPSLSFVSDVYSWAVSHGKWYGTSQLRLAQPGNLIIFGTARNKYHIGIVDHVSGSTVYVISGNTPNPSNSGQWGVYDKRYSLSSSVFYGLVHP